MSQTSTDPTQGMSKAVMGAALVWLAVIVYASANSIVSLLADIGREHPVMGRNAITLCNLLFLGSLLSLIPMGFMFYKDWTLANLRKLTRRDWGVLSLSALLSSAITPALFFIALDYTTVTNVVLIGRIEPPLFLLTAYLILGEKLDPWAFGAGLIALGGALAMLVMNSEGMSFEFGRGEIATVFATLSFIASTIVSRVGLGGIPLGIFSIYRTVVGTIIYYFLAMYLYGALHFQDIFAGIVWKWVWVYAVVVIIVGQFSWTLGLKYARSGDISLATSFSPVAALIIAMLMLGEDPGPGLVPGGAIILIGIGIGQFGRLRRQKAERRAAQARKMDVDDALEIEGRVNFKGA
ncbi:DMT family transporter [uncultured Roseovarius sp.]|uniref:DMT family transporter n=1 Tax=Roseovarius sp. TaxID=1486281 RepID=UPI0025D07ABD|nr:DMT family transporter [uncultured Roseovarius sp.]